MRDALSAALRRLAQVVCGLALFVSVLIVGWLLVAGLFILVSNLIWP